MKILTVSVLTRFLTGDYESVRLVADGKTAAKKSGRPGAYKWSPPPIRHRAVGKLFYQ